MRPTESFTLWGGSVEIRSFGTMTGDWSLKGDTPAEAEKNNPGVLAKISQLADESGCRIYAPKPTAFNAQICRKADLGDDWLPGVLYRGHEADGVILDKMGDAFGLASADCLTAVIRDAKSGRVAAAHAGRDSLVDRGILNGRKARTPESVISGAMAALVDGRSLDKSLLRAFLACGIGPEDFDHGWDHPTWGRANRKLVQHVRARYGTECVLPPRDAGRLSLTTLARIQCGMAGILDAHVGSDSTDTFADKDSYGFPLWHSHRRDRNGKRNFILVIRRF